MNLLSRFVPRFILIDWPQRLLAGGLAGFSLWLMWQLSDWLTAAPQHGHLVMGSIAASAFLVFVVPHSPMARPWPLVGGHAVAALSGMLCASLISDQAVAIALAIGLTILLMYPLRCLHPPGAATALAAVLAHQGVLPGYSFLLVPVAFNVLVLLLLGQLYRVVLAMYERRRTPILSNDAVLQQADSAGSNTGLLPEDIDAALEELHAMLDVSREDLAQIYRLAEQHAAQRDSSGVSCGAIMLRDVPVLEFATELEEAWQLLQQSGAPALPVLNRARRVEGLLTSDDFSRHARLMDAPDWKRRLQALIRRTPGLESNKPEVVGQIMSYRFVTVAQDEAVQAVLALARYSARQPLVVLDGERRFAGLLPADAIIAALYQARLQP